MDSGELDAMGPADELDVSSAVAFECISPATRGSSWPRPGHHRPPEGGPNPTQVTQRLRMRPLFVMGVVLGVGVLLVVAAETRGEVAPPRPVDVDTLKGIVVPSPLSEAHRLAVEQLREWLNRIYGVSPEVIPSQAKPVTDGSVIFLGREAALASGRVRPAELAAVGPGGYVIKSGDGHVVIAGQTDWTTTYGVAAFLEKAGVRFYVGYPFRDRNPVRKPDDRSLPVLSVTDRPAFVFRPGLDPMVLETSREVADPRQGANPEIFTEEAGSNLWIDHTSGYLVPKALYYDEHPEYYPLLENGQRIAKTELSDAQTALCLSNPDVTRISTERMLAWIGKQPDKRFFFLTYGDTGLYCQCAACLKLDEGMEPTRGRSGLVHYAQRHFHWINPVARAVAGKYPDRILFTFAYGGSDKAPKSLQVEPNVWVIASTGLGTVHFWDHVMSDPAAEAQAFAKIDGWLRIVPDRLLVCEYLSKAYLPTMLESTAGRLRAYAKRGLIGVAFTYGAPASFQPVWRYVFTRIAWNPQRNASELANEIIAFYYGPAAQPVSQLFAISHERYEQMLKDGVRPKQPWEYVPGYYAPEFTGKMMACFAAAEQASGKNRTLKAEIQKEESLFLQDVIEHMPSYDLTDENTACLHGYLKRGRELAKETGTEKDFVSAVRNIAQSLEKQHKGYVKLFDGWLKEWFWWLREPEPGQDADPGGEGEATEE